MAAKSEILVGYQVFTNGDSVAIIFSADLRVHLQKLLREMLDY